MKLSVCMNRNEVNMGWVYLAVQFLVLPTLLLAANGFWGLGLSDGALNFTMFCMNLALTIGVFHRFLWQSLCLTLNQLWYSLRFAFLGFLIYYALTFLLGLLIGRLFPDFTNANDQNIISMLDDNRQLLSIGMILFVPVTEESLYRGLIFGTIHKRSRFAAYLISMLAFSALHVVGYVGSAHWLTLLLSFLQYLPAGFALAWTYERSDTIWSSILVHMTVNQIAMSLI